MSGHNKWSSIKHKKGAADAKRGKVFSRLAREMIMAAREGGGDVEMNARLRQAVTAAKNANMPNDNIDRAIRKGTGEIEGGNLEELSYEGYAPGGVAVMVNCLSDNRNRTAADVRSVFTKYNASMAANGSVSWMFNRRARFVVEGPQADEEKLLEILLDAGVDVEDLSAADGAAEIIAPAEAFAGVLAALEAAGIAPSESKLVLVAANTVPVTSVDEVRKVLRFIEALEDCDDVQEVYSNLDAPDAVMDQLAGE